MHLERLVLQNFRSYSQAMFDFSKETTLIVGSNTAGKTNIVEAIFLLSLGKSFRAERDMRMIRFGKEVGRVQGSILEERKEKMKLEVMFAQGNITSGRFTKRYFINAAVKRRVDFAGIFPVVLFCPEELDIVTTGPSLRRRFLDNVLEQTDHEYRLAQNVYDRSLRQRNALLVLAKEIGKRNKEQFAYWDELLIKNGAIITQKRGEFIDFLNQSIKDIFSFTTFYDKSVISEERLMQYKEAEIGAGVTLVGPHRDDFLIFIDNHEVKYFGSRGQQRLVVLQLKLLQRIFIEQQLQTRPLLLLDDIFSELDATNTSLVLDMLDKQQTIMTTADMNLRKNYQLNDVHVIELKKE